MEDFIFGSQGILKERLTPQQSSPSCYIHSVNEKYIIKKHSVNEQVVIILLLTDPALEKYYI
jgi:hypothetical protein